MLIKVKSSKEIDNVLGDGQLKSPFFIHQTSLDNGYQVFNCVLLTNHIIQLHYPSHHTNSNDLVLVLQQESKNGNT